MFGRTIPSERTPMADRPPAMSATIEIDLFTDPACPFAFSAEPVRRRLRWLFGAALAWRPRMIVLTLEDGEADKLAEGAPGLQRRYGMPIAAGPYPRAASSEPACRAVVAARRRAPRVGRGAAARAAGAHDGRWAARRSGADRRRGHGRGPGPRAATELVRRARHRGRARRRHRRGARAVPGRAGARPQARGPGARAPLQRAQLRAAARRTAPPRPACRASTPPRSTRR